MVIVFGSINLDLVARVARLPRLGETLPGRAFAMAPGGKGANQALAARRAGAEVTLVGAVGGDEFAQPALELLRADGVHLSHVASVAAPTGVALIHVDDAGRNAITVIAGANALARAGQLQPVPIGPGATLVMQLELPVAEVAAAARTAHRSGARVVLNAAPALPLPDGLVADVDVLVVNEHEAATLGEHHGWPVDPVEFAAAAHRATRTAIVVTLGADGAIACGDEGAVRCPSPSIDVADTTGAGDALVGAFVAALDRGAAFERALREGVAAGALACTRAGAQAAMPSRAAIAARVARV